MYSLKWFRLKFSHLRYIGAFVNKPCTCIETFHTYSINIFVLTLRVDRLYPFCLQRWDTVHIAIEYHFSSNLIVGLWTHRSYPINRITYRDACNTTHIIRHISSQDNSLIRKQLSFEWCQICEIWKKFILASLCLEICVSTRKYSSQI